jgi:D-ribose pyranose/furanose isomerase RbsD
MAGMSAAQLEHGLAEVRTRLNTAASSTPNIPDLIQALVIAIERMMETSVLFARQTEDTARQNSDDVTAARLDNTSGTTAVQSRVTEEVRQTRERWRVEVRWDKCNACSVCS